jgi:8-oxo-dGTP pyrophosphatase MutT (NUDIX family)
MTAGAEHRSCIVTIDMIDDLRVELRSLGKRWPDRLPAIDRVGALLTAAPNAADRGWYEPGHLTASACVLHPREERVALVLHARLQRWLQPGGHLEAGDGDACLAAQREVAEECGLTETVLLVGVQGRLVDVDIHPIPAGRGEPTHLHFDLRYAFRARHAELRVSDESLRVEWTRTQDLDAVGADEALLRLVRRALEMRGDCI